MKFMLNLSRALIRFLDHCGGVTLFAVGLLLLSTFVHGQNIRWDLGEPGSAGAATTQGAGLPYLVAIPGVALNWCNYPANTVPCTNFANTYPSLSSNSPCATNAQVVLQGSSTCQATGDAFGNLGAYVAPNASCGGLTCYAYTLTANGASTGPFLWVWGGTNMVNTAVTYSSTPVFPVTAQIQLFTITLTGSAVATMTVASNVAAPAIIFFQITQDSSGGHPFTWPLSNTIGGCVIGSAANQVTTEEFVWNGVNATAVSGGCVTGPGPSVVVGNLNISGLTASSPTCTDVNKNLTSSCNTVNGITVNGQTIAPGGSGNVNPGNAAHSLALNEGNGNQLGAAPLSLNQVPVGKTSADPAGSTLPNCTDTAGQHLNYATSGQTFSCGTSTVSGHSIVASATLGSSCQLASNNGEWNCSGTFSWGATLGSSSYQISCMLSQPQPTGSYSIPAGYDAHIFFGTQTTTGFTYYINDDHSGSNGAIYIVYCEAYM
jgi:hypothetical protein